MTGRLETDISSLRLKNPVIAGPAEHLIDPDNVRRALRTGAPSPSRSGYRNG